MALPLSMRLLIVALVLSIPVLIGYTFAMTPAGPLPPSMVGALFLFTAGIAALIWFIVTFLGDARRSVRENSRHGDDV